MAIAVVERGSSELGSGCRSRSAVLDVGGCRLTTVGMVVDRCMNAGERGRRGLRTRPVRFEEPVLVPMSEAEGSAAVAALPEIIAAWWTRQQSGALLLWMVLCP
jgi:hypothetical protein